MVVATERASSAAVYESGTRKRRGTMVMKWLKRFDVLLHGARNQKSIKLRSDPCRASVGLEMEADGGPDGEGAS